ncbi:MAG: flippase [Minisyncoccota bacterium]
MKKFSQAVVWLTISEIIFNLAGYFIHSFVGRILGPADYGRFSLVVTLTTMIIILIGNGIPTAMSKYLSEVFENEPERILGIKRQAIKLQIFLMFGVTVVFFFASPLIAWALSDMTLTPLFQLSSLIIPAFAAASFYFYYFTGLHFFRLQAILKTLRALGRVFFIILFAYFFGLKGALSGYIAAPLFVFLIALCADIFITHRYFAVTKKPKTIPVAFSGKTLLLYAGPLTFFLVFYELISTLDLYFVKSLLKDDYLTGIYSAAITVGRIPYYLFYALTIVLLPAISKTTAERKHKETESLVNTSLRLLVLLLFPLVTLLIVYAKQILHLFYGSAYAQAVQPMSIFAVGVGFLTVFYVLSFALNGAGLVKIPMRLTFFGFIGMIILNFLLIPKWGISGASLSTTLVSFFLMLGILFHTKLHFNVFLSIQTIVLSCCAVFFITMLSFILPDGTFNFFFSGAFLFILYFVFLKISGELRTEDMAPFLKLFRKKQKTLQ